MLTLIVIGFSVIAVSVAAYVAGARKSRKAITPEPVSVDLSSGITPPYVRGYSNSIYSFTSPDMDIQLRHTSDYIQNSRRRVPDKTRTVELRDRYKIVNNS